MKFSNRPSFICVNLASIKKNIITIKKLVKPKTQVMAVVKANAYGHGAVEVAQVALEAGAQWLGVALTQEAAQLREAGIIRPIMVLGYTAPNDYAYMIKNQIRPAIYTLEAGLAFANEAQKQGVSAAVHIKIDTGMGRIGFMPNSMSLQEILELSKMPNLVIEGIFSHLARADEINQDNAKAQINSFIKFTEQLKEKGLNIPILHCSNTAAALSMPESHMDMIRIGIGIYGLYPSKAAKNWGVNLEEALSLKSCLSNVKLVGPGTCISYGHTWQAKDSAIIGTIPIGYADGIDRNLSNRGFVLVSGQRVPIIGRICMDQLMVDLTHIPNPKIGDEVVILGKQINQCIKVDDIAELINTINYEVTCRLSNRLPRYYKCE